MKSILWLLTQPKLTAGFRGKEGGVGECYMEKRQRGGKMNLFPLHGLVILCFMFFSVHQSLSYTSTTNSLPSPIRQLSLVSTPTRLPLIAAEKFDLVNTQATSYWHKDVTDSLEKGSRSVYPMSPGEGLVISPLNFLEFCLLPYYFNVLESIHNISGLFSTRE